MSGKSWVKAVVSALILIAAFVLLTPGRSARPAPPITPVFAATTETIEDPARAPRPGTWIAKGTYAESRGYFGRTVGETITRRWTIARRCRSGSCSYTITREMRDRSPVTAPLTRDRGGWHASFPALRLQCSPQDTWEQRMAFAFRFTNGGRAATAEETHQSYSPECGNGYSRVSWTAERISERSTTAANRGPVDGIRGPVNGISERAMADSLDTAVLIAIPQLSAQLAEALGKSVDLVPVSRGARCRSRENTPSKRGAPFACVVPFKLAGTETDDLTIEILIGAIEGSCWRGVGNRFREAGKVQSFDPRSVELHYAKNPLRGCAR